LKFNQDWLKGQDYQRIIVDSWVHLKENSECSFMQQMESNLAKVKQASLFWSWDFNLKNQALLWEVESRIECLMIDRPMESLSKYKEI
jgi:hypothetical protein